MTRNEAVASAARHGNTKHELSHRFERTCRQSLTEGSLTNGAQVERVYRQSLTEGSLTNGAQVELMCHQGLTEGSLTNGAQVMKSGKNPKGKAALSSFD